MSAYENNKVYVCGGPNCNGTSECVHVNIMQKIEKLIKIPGSILRVGGKNMKVISGV